MERNVGTIERWGSVLGGGALLAYALSREPRLSPLTGALALGGATLLYRGATAHCPLYSALGFSTADLADDWKEKPLTHLGEGITTPTGRWPLPEGARRIQPGASRDVVEEASYESFPASDPPAFTPGKIG